MRTDAEAFDMAIRGSEAKQKIIKDCQPPTADWEHYADRLHDIAYKYGYEQAKKDAEELFRNERKELVELVEEKREHIKDNYIRYMMLLYAEQMIHSLPSVCQTEQQPCEDAISRQGAIDKFEQWLRADGYNWGELNMLKAVLYELRTLPSIEPKHGENTLSKQHDSDKLGVKMGETCTDCVSRQIVLSYIDRILNQGTGKNKSLEFLRKYVEKLPSVEPKQAENGFMTCPDSENTHDRTTDDLISRQAAIDCCRNEWEEEVAERIESLPPVSPARPTGHWYKKETFNGHWKCCCSECNYNGRFEWITCPNCGADMRGEQDG